MGLLSCCGCCSCSKRCAATFAVLLVALAVIVEVISDGEGASCSQATHCNCPADFSTICHGSKCYGTKPDGRCQGKQNGTPMGDGLWCHEGGLFRTCRSKLTMLDGAIEAFKQSDISTLWLIWRMRLFPGNRKAQIDGCAKFSAFGWNVPEAKEPLMKWGAVDAAAAAVYRFRGDREIESRCFNALAALSLYNRAVSLRVGELGIVEATLDFWRRNFDDPGMVVANYFGCYQDYCDENRERMRKAGAIKAMFDFGGEGAKHFHNGGAQFSIWCAFSSFHTKENHDEFRRLNGTRHLFAVFRDHGKSYRVREEVLQATKGLCAWRVNRDDLAEAGFPTLLASALKEDKKDPQVQALGLETLRMFVDSNSTLRKQLIAEGGIDIAFEALAIHAQKLLDTRVEWDKQNVYGDLNDHQYNVPGGAAELLYSLALDGKPTLKAMLEADAIRRLEASIKATESRVNSVRHRTRQAACQVLRMLKEVVEDPALEAERTRVLAERWCQTTDIHPLVITNNIPFEP